MPPLTETDPALAQQAAPDPYRNHQAVLDLVKRTYDEFKKGRQDHLRTKERNLLFNQSHQWIMWDQAMGRYRPAQLPKDTPTPVTNKYAPTIKAVASVFARVEPKLNFRPGSDEEPADRAAADVSSRLIQVIEDETDVRFNRQVLSRWVAHTGGAWLEQGYDPDPRWGTRQVEAEACAACGYQRTPDPPAAPDPMTGEVMPAACPQCGEPLTLTTLTVPVGKMYTDPVSLFEGFFDPSITDWKKHRKFIREKAVPEDEAKARWNHIRDSIKPNTVAQDYNYMAKLATMPPLLDDKARQRWLMAGQGEQIANRVSEQWYWQLPDETYPEGLLAVVVGRETVAYAGPLPYTAQQPDGSRKPFLPFVWFPFDLLPGSFWPKTVADDVALKQKQRNQWESIIMASGMRLGSPFMLIPTQSNLPRNQEFGPGAKAYYNAMGPGNAKPEVVWGRGFPMAFLEMIRQNDADMEELASTFDVLKGDRPPGVSAGIALQILQERGMSNYGPLFIMWEQAWSEWARQTLEIFREYVTEERILRIQGRDGTWEVQKFLGGDLQGQVDVIPEAGSSMPRSTLLDRAEMEQLLAMRVLNPQDPETQYKILEVYGRTGLLPSMALDTKNAIREDEAFEALAADPNIALLEGHEAEFEALDYPTLLQVIQQGLAPLGVRLPIPEVKPAIDGHAVHSREHGTWAKKETFERLPKVVQVLAAKHKAYHDQLLIQQMVAMQQGPQASLRGGYTEPAPAQRSPLNRGSSPQRMDGDYREMEQTAGASGAS